MNRRKLKKCLSKFKGVSKNRDKWIASIGIKGGTHRVGRFDNEEDAAIAYDVAAQLFFGEFARLNFPLKS